MKLRACKGSLVFPGDRDMCTQQFLLDTCEMYSAHWSRGWLWGRAGGRGIWLHGIYIHIGQKGRKVLWLVPGEGIRSLWRAEDHKTQPSFWLQEVQAPAEDNSYQLTPFPMVP